MNQQSGQQPVYACAVVRTNRNSRITGWSGEAEAIFGWAEGEAKGRNIDELLRTDYAGSSFGDVFSVLLANGWAEIEIGQTAKNGETLKVTDTVTLLRDGTGGITGMVHMLRQAAEAPQEDIDEEPAPQEHEQELLDLLVGTADDLWVYDIPEGGQEQFGFSPKGGNPGGDGGDTAGMVHPDDWERVDNAIHTAMAEKREWYRVQCRTLSADGQYIWSLTLGKIRYDESDKPVRISGMTIGIPEIQALEAQLSGQAKTLEKMTQEAAGRDKLEADFNANFSHELKTPLSVMMVDLQMIERCLREPGDDSREALAQRMLSTRLNAFKLLRLIGNMTDFMRIKTGKMKARLVNADVVTTISDVVETAKEYAGDMGVELRFESSCASRTMPLDAEKLERILLNLLSNSLRHTRAGGHILVRLRDAQNYVAFSVRDDGAGMPDAIKGAVFDAFKPAALFPSLGEGGAGLGLPLTKGLVDLLHGKIWFDSTAGQGCEFFVALPVLQPDWQAPPLDTEGIPRERRAEIEFSGLIKPQ